MLSFSTFLKEKASWNKLLNIAKTPAGPHNPHNLLKRYKQYIISEGKHTTHQCSPEWPTPEKSTSFSFFPQKQTPTSFYRQNDAVRSCPLYFTWINSTWMIEGIHYSVYFDINIPEHWATVHVQKTKLEVF